MEKIWVRHTSIIINDYVLGTEPILEKKLSVWNEVTYSYDTKGFYYDEENKQLRIPRGVAIGYLEKMFGNVLRFDFNHDEAEKAVYHLTTEPRNDIQRRGIAFLTGSGDFKYTTKYSQLSLNFDTGYGKTYTAIVSMAYLKMRSIIIVHSDKLKTQWKSEFLDKTNINEQEIFDIKGSQGISHIIKYPKAKYKVFLVNHQTIAAYAKREGWSAVTDLFRLMKIGVKIYDEAHFNFENIIKIDLFTNTKKNFYLTANFERGDYTENRLFDICFNNVIRYGNEEKSKVRKHIKYLAVLYHSKPSVYDRMSIKNRYNFDKNKYIDYQMRNGLIIDVIRYVIDKIVNAKLLIFLSTIDAVDATTEILKEVYPEKIVGAYHSKLLDEYKAESLNADIIISTPKSLGTGVDIHGLRYIINTEPYSSSVTANQVPGRLRPLNDEDHSGYIELVDFGFDTVFNMYKKRLKYLKDKCESIKKFTYRGEQ
jgi:superfamily II DNA or RNA helicase